MALVYAAKLLTSCLPAKQVQLERSDGSLMIHWPEARRLELASRILPHWPLASHDPRMQRSDRFMLKYTKRDCLVLLYRTTDEPEYFGTILGVLNRSDVAIARPQRMTANWITMPRLREMASSTHSVICRAALLWTTIAARFVASVPVAESEAQGMWTGWRGLGNLSRTLTPASRVKRPGGSEPKITAARIVNWLNLA